MRFIAVSRAEAERVFPSPAEKRRRERIAQQLARVNAQPTPRYRVTWRNELGGPYTKTFLTFDEALAWAEPRDGRLERLDSTSG
jgi:hypothetical protein